jgi:DNA polymerase III sliding clamp (beta) subunit (PCNA family)
MIRVFFQITPATKESNITLAHILNKALQNTLFATGTDVLRAMLTGVVLTFKKML